MYGKETQMSFLIFGFLISCQQVNTQESESSLQIRLADGNTILDGRVEVYHNGEWGTVCDDQWDILDAEVVCSQLGFGYPVEAISRSQYGVATGNILLDEVSCHGDETSLDECRMNPIGLHDCRHEEDAGVICSPADVRLIGGQTFHEGIVETFVRGNWRTICSDASWDIRDADVVCRQLGLGGARQAAVDFPLYNHGSNRGSWLAGVRCNGDEETLSTCPKDGIRLQDCNYRRSAGIECALSSTVSDIRLVGGPIPLQGRVEVKIGDQWGTICDDDWDIDDANVVCRHLGFGNATEAPHNARFGRGTDFILLDNVHCEGSEETLSFCRTNRVGDHNCEHSEDASVICNPGDVIHAVRLIDGYNIYEGRVEVFANGEWGSICDDVFDFNDANVVCRQLDYGLASQVLYSARFGEGSGPIWLDDVRCQGDEADISRCPRNQLGSHNCGHDEDAGVVCTGHTITEIRVVGGSIPYEGRVEVLINTHWGTICDDSWDLLDGDVVCRQLGYGPAKSTPGASHFGEGVGRIWLDDVHCTGREESLLLCRHNGLLVSDCKHASDAGVVCTPPDIPAIRLAGGPSDREGLVEIYANGQWGTVCGDGWDRKDAIVACRQLGFTKVNARAIRAASVRYGVGSGPIWLDDVDCVGTENSLSECASNGIGKHNCEHFEDTGIACYKRRGQEDTRLVNGSSEYDGNVRLLIDNVWKDVCSNNWNINNANVFCRQLDFGTVMSVYTSQGATTLHRANIACTGTEDEFAQCETDVNIVGRCVDNSIVGVSCSGITGIRLADGSNRFEGRVEVRIKDQWGTVCDDRWDLQDAKVVCRELGFGPPLSISLSARRFGRGSGPIWMDDVECTGSETNLAKCVHAGYGQSDCAHHEDAGVICSERTISDIRLVEGTVISEGLVEVMVEGSWYSVCNTLWDKNDADVTCKRLGFPASSSATYRQSPLSTTSRPITIGEVDCLGIEEQLSNCRLNLALDVCPGNERAGVVCQKRIRLLNGKNPMEGRVEVYSSASRAWGSVCDDTWDTSDANVVCFELGYGTARAAPIRAYFGEGTGPILFDNVQCYGNEKTILDCLHEGIGNNNCFHKEDAGVICNGESWAELSLVGTGGRN